MAVSDEGVLIGCGQVRPHKGGIWEMASVAVDKAWRGKGLAIAGGKFIVNSSPRPLWGTCISTSMPFYQRFGAVEVVDPKQMPSFLRFRRRLANILFRLARKKEYLAVMVLDRRKIIPDIVIFQNVSSAREEGSGKCSAPSSRA